MAKPKKQTQEIRVSDGLLEAAQRLAAKQNIAVADVLAQAVERGLPILIEDDNKINWWDKESTKAEIRNLVESIPEDKYNDAITHLKGLSNPG